MIRLLKIFVVALLVISASGCISFIIADDPYMYGIEDAPVIQTVPIRPGS